uniref:Uncharacterized protein n=1 Tax=Pongo abelii TaxID=9601 RepID=A0A8I5YQL7_PONAB
EPFCSLSGLSLRSGGRNVRLCRLSTLVFCQFRVILLSLTAVNIKTAEIYRASFQDRGPEEQLRAARTLAGGPMVGDTQECHRSEDRQEHHQLTRIADPMLAEMGKNLKEAMKMLEDSQRRTEEENGKELISGDIPGPLQGR